MHKLIKHCVVAMILLSATNAYSQSCLGPRDGGKIKSVSLSKEGYLTVEFNWSTYPKKICQVDYNLGGEGLPSAQTCQRWHATLLSTFLTQHSVVLEGDSVECLAEEVDIQGRLDVIRIQ